jgi:hypothetical protein
MKKLPLALIAILTLSISAYFVSCKKETQQAMLLPAIQTIREVPKKNWEIAEKTVLRVSYTFSEKIKEEFANYGSDSAIVVSCWIKFKDLKYPKKLPFTISGLGGTKYYFYTIDEGKPIIYFHNSAVDDFNVSGTSSALPMEQISFNFTKIEFE